MKAARAQILWTPTNWPSARYDTQGQVAVYEVGKAGANWDRFAMKGGAAYLRVKEAKGDTALALLFIEFQTLLVRDGIDPRVAHRAFLQIDEYREASAPDTPGAAP